MMCYREEEVSEKTFVPVQLDLCTGIKWKQQMIVAGDIILQVSAFVSQTDFLYCEVYGLSGTQSGTMKRNRWGSSEFCLMSYCSSTLTSVILSREFIGCKTCNMAAQGTFQFHQKEGLTYELMDLAIQCLVCYMIFQAKLWLFWL